MPVPVPPAVLEHHLQAAQRIDQPTAAAAAAAALVAAPRRQPLRHPRRRQPPTAAPERPSAAAAAARTGRRGRTAAGDDATRCGIGRGTPPFHVAAGPRFGWVSERRSCSPARNSTGNPAQGPRQRLQLAAPSAAAAGSPDRPCTRAEDRAASRRAGGESIGVCPLTEPGLWRRFDDFKGVLCALQVACNSATFRRRPGGVVCHHAAGLPVAGEHHVRGRRAPTRQL